MRRFSPGAPHVKEAAIWLARLRADDRSAEDERAFRAWLMADPSHAVAFEAVNGVWDSVGALSRDMRSGEVQLEKSGVSRRKLLSAGVGLTVAAGGTLAFLEAAQAKVYRTDVGEQKHVTLDDGTGIFLDTDTKLLVDFNDELRKVDLRYGRANFRVAPDAKRSFAVEAAQKLVIGPRSTFDIRCEGDDISVLLIHGRATVRNVADAGGGRQLSDGEMLQFASGRPPRLDKPNLLPLLAWHTGQAIFENSPLSDVVREMNRYSTIKLEVDDTRIAGMKVSGVYRVGDNANFARSLARLLPVEIRVVGDHIELVGDDARILQG